MSSPSHLSLGNTNILKIVKQRYLIIGASVWCIFKFIFSEEYDEFDLKNLSFIIFYYN
jgi:hypothetical protein